jgi:hypothetical protein
VGENKDIWDSIFYDQDDDWGLIWRKFLNH